jgi:hypothetical protein
LVGAGKVYTGVITCTGVLFVEEQAAIDKSITTQVDK